MINTYTKEMTEAYFKGGNAKDKGSIGLRSILETIKAFVEEEDQKEVEKKEEEWSKD